MTEKQPDTPRSAEPRSIVLCPNCGFPNRPKDARCGYCEVPIGRPASLPPWKWAAWLVSRLKWRWSARGRANAARRPLGKGMSALIGFLLCLAGGFLLASSIFTKDFSNCLIALFFLLYGIFTLKHLMRK